jgi:hypothetical protein
MVRRDRQNPSAFAFDRQEFLYSRGHDGAHGRVYDLPTIVCLHPIAFLQSLDSTT